MHLLKEAATPQVRCWPLACRYFRCLSVMETRFPISREREHVMLSFTWSANTPLSSTAESRPGASFPDFRGCSYEIVTGGQAVLLLGQVHVIMHRHQVR